MRENRTYGSEGGGAGKPALPTPITTAPHRCFRTTPSPPPESTTLPPARERLLFYERSEKSFGAVLKVIWRSTMLACVGWLPLCGERMTEFVVSIASNIVS